MNHGKCPLQFFFFFYIFTYNIAKNSVLLWYPIATTILHLPMYTVCQHHGFPEVLLNVIQNSTDITVMKIRDSYHVKIATMSLDSETTSP